LKRLPLGKWHHLGVTWDGSGRAAGLRIYRNGELLDTEAVQDNLAENFTAAAELQTGNKQLGDPYRGQMDDLRVYSRALEESELKYLAVEHPIRVVLSGVSGKRTEEESRRCREYFLTSAAPEELRSRFARLQELNREKDELKSAIPTVMIMDEMEKPRETFVHARGDYRAKTERVTPGVPSVLPPLPEDGYANRLTLARWLVDARHPLTARVAVNRYWQMYFGTGIVKTSEDFGSQGEPPSHPELLDWLATEFVRSGWDIRAMQRLIVTSAAYRQSSHAAPELLERDPENRLLARGPRFRLGAELIRDNALAAAGLLNRELGGPPVFPYQPAGLWEEMAFGDGFSAQAYRQGNGKDLYRRSLYTFWKRTVPPPSLAAFDAPDREKCTARRALTNTPLQALVLLNDPTYVEAARGLAARALLEVKGNDVTRIRQAFRLATARFPSSAEMRVFRALLSQQLALYRKDPGAAEKLMRVGDMKAPAAVDPVRIAAWTAVAGVILNLDETITKQ
jgi:hypothetical protein